VIIFSIVCAGFCNFFSTCGYSRFSDVKCDVKLVFDVGVSDMASTQNDDLMSEVPTSNFTSILHPLLNDNYFFTIISSQLVISDYIIHVK
jgi:hypothetical protein